MQTYELTEPERGQHEEITARITTHGGLYHVDRDDNLLLDGAGNPVLLDYVVLRSRRFLVDPGGVLWRFFAEGSAKDPGAPGGGGAPWRNNRVEMWTGRWRAVVGPDGAVGYAKQLTARPIDKRINGHPGMSNIDWYRNVKGYKHPFDAPHAPSEQDIRLLRRRRDVTTGEVRARMDGELAKAGLAAAPASGAAPAGEVVGGPAAPSAAKTKRRTNKRAAEQNNG